MEIFLTCFLNFTCFQISYSYFSECFVFKKILLIYNCEYKNSKTKQRFVLYLFKSINFVFSISMFISANRSNTNAQLSLALAWNRSDIAKNEIFDKQRRTTFQVCI